LIVIAIGIFVVVGIGLGMVRSRQVNEQNRLNEELTLVQSRLSVVQPEKLSSQQTELEKQLSQTISQCDAVKAILSRPVGSISVSRILFDVAEAYELKITRVTSPGLAGGDLEGVTCSVINVSATVEGDVPNLVNFIAKLNSQFATGVVNPIKITIPEAASEEKASADIQLVVYTYYGD
jgi:hypothetical protein